jgi:hypothetical protein
MLCGSEGILVYVEKLYLDYKSSPHILARYMVGGLSDSDYQTLLKYKYPDGIPPHIDSKDYSVLGEAIMSESLCYVRNKPKRGTRTLTRKHRGAGKTMKKRASRNRTR